MGTPAANRSTAAAAAAPNCASERGECRSRRGWKGEGERRRRRGEAGGRTLAPPPPHSLASERRGENCLTCHTQPSIRPPTAALARDPAGRSGQGGYAWPWPTRSPSPIHSQLFPHSIPSHPSHPSNLTICISGGRRKTSRKNPSYSSRRSFLVSCS